MIQHVEIFFFLFFGVKLELLNFAKTASAWDNFSA